MMGILPSGVAMSTSALPVPCTASDIDSESSEVRIQEWWGRRWGQCESPEVEAAMVITADFHGPFLLQPQRCKHPRIEVCVC